MERFLIVNADDFGADEPTNLGIIDAFEHGIVRSASLLGNGDGFEHAVALARTHPTLDIGAHLNALRGTSLSHPRTLVRDDGQMLGSAVSFLVRYIFRHKTMLREIEDEFVAQIERLRAAGIVPSHLDTEKHLHVLPGIAAIVLRLAERYRIPAVRFPLEPSGGTIQPDMRQRLKVLGASLFEPSVRALFAKSGIAHPGSFFGISLSGRFTHETLAALFAALPEGVSELSCHPGRAGSTYGAFISTQHESELAALVAPSVKEALIKNHITLIPYRFLHE